MSLDSHGALSAAAAVPTPVSPDAMDLDVVSIATNDDHAGPAQAGAVQLTPVIPPIQDLRHGGPPRHEVGPIATAPMV